MKKAMPATLFRLSRSRALAAAMLAAACAMPVFLPPAMAADHVVASLGPVNVTEADVLTELGGLPPAERAAIRNNRAGLENWLRQRVVTDTVLREARGKGWADRPEVKARIDAAVREVTARIISSTYLESVAQVPADYPPDTDVAAAYAQGKGNFNVPATYRVAQIYLAVPAGNEVDAAKVADKAKRVAAQARSGDFAAVAKAESQDSNSAGRGGEVGTLTLPDLMPEIREVVGTMKPGQVSDPIRSGNGIHIVKLIDQQAPRTATLDEMKPRLQQALRQQRQRQLLQEYVGRLAPADRVTIDGAALDAALKSAN